MTFTAVQNAINKVKNGTFVSVEYETIPTMLAFAKKEGISITKRTTKVVRLGVDYSHIARVIAKRAAENYTPPERQNPYEWIVKNSIAKKIDGESIYLQLANVRGKSHAKSTWFMNGVEVSFDDVVKYLAPSYLNKSSELPEIQKVNIENLIRIGG